MKQGVRDTLDKADDLRRSRKFGQAIDLLDQITQEDLDSLLDLERSSFHRIRARCFRFLADYERALEEALSAQRFSLSSGNDSLVASNKQLLGMLYLELGEPVNAIETLTEAYVLRKLKLPEEGVIHRSLVNLGLAHLIRGDLRKAWRLMNEAVESSQSYYEEQVQISKKAAEEALGEVRTCQFSKARVGLYLGEFRESESVLQSYAGVKLEPASQAELLQLRGMLSVLRLDKAAADQTLSEAIKLFDKDNTPRDRNVCLEFLGLNEYFAGNFSEAGECYRAILGGTGQITALARAQTLRLQTDVLVAQNRHEDALATAEEAEKTIEKVQESIESGGLHRAYGRIYAYQGKTEEANKHFAKAVEILTTAGARYELALTYVAYGQSDIFSEELRLDRLSMAIQEFDSMGVSKWVENIQAVMAHLEELAASEDDISDADLKMTWADVERLEEKLGT